MAIYVDPQMKCVPNGNWKWRTACHMFADSLEELHSFAGRIGLKRQWFQNKRVPHYDLNDSRRDAAIRAGAIPLDRSAAVDMWIRKGWFSERLCQKNPVPTGSAQEPNIGI